MVSITARPWAQASPAANPQADNEAGAQHARYRRRNRINGQWSPRLIEMLESPAYRALSLAAHRVISRIEIELAHHGGNDNGRLPVTKQDFIDYGVHNDAIAPAIREAEALGFIRVTERGHGGNAEYRKPNLFRLTFAHDRNSRSEPPTHDWRKIKTLEDAEAIAGAARGNKSQAAVSLGRRSAGKNRNRSRKPGPKPVPETRTENANFPVLETRTTGSVRKPGPLSIYPVRERTLPRSQRTPKLPWSMPTVIEFHEPEDVYYCTPVPREQQNPTENTTMAMSNRLPMLAEEIRRAHIGIVTAAHTAAERAIEVGHALIEAKKLLKHGEWLPWLREHAQIPERTAQLYMRVAASGLKSETVADIGLQAAAKPITVAAFTERFCALLWTIIAPMNEDQHFRCLDLITEKQPRDEFERKVEDLCDELSDEQQAEINQAVPQAFAAFKSLHEDFDVDVSDILEPYMLRNSGPDPRR